MMALVISHLAAPEGYQDQAALTAPPDTTYGVRFSARVALRQFLAVLSVTAGAERSARTAAEADTSLEGWSMIAVCSS